MKDQNFDNRYKHLSKNIYGSAKGQLRLIVLQRDLAELVVQSNKKLRILDAGCGAGHMARWCASFGHEVVACDSSAIILEQAKGSATKLPNITFLNCSIQNLEDIDCFDLILCHAVLEWVVDVDSILSKLGSLLNPNGKLSLMFYNAWAREFSQLVYGNFSYVEKDYNIVQKVKLNPHHPRKPDEIENKLHTLGLSISSRSGIRVFYDILRDRTHYEQYPAEIIKHELRISQQSPYWQMGRYVHFLAIMS